MVHAYFNSLWEVTNQWREKVGTRGFWCFACASKGIRKDRDAKRGVEGEGIADASDKLVF